MPNVPYDLSPFDKEIFFCIVIFDFLESLIFFSWEGHLLLDINAWRVLVLCIRGASSYSCDFHA